MEIELIDYTGSYPNLCNGKLTLRVDGELITFGCSTDADYPRFWYSTGYCGFRNSGEDIYIIKGKWDWFVPLEKDLKRLEKFLPYKNEIMELFNKSVEFGCCGGCL